MRNPISLIFDSTVIWIGNVRLTYANVSGLYIVIIILIAQVIIVCMVSNISQEYDLKSEHEAHCGSTETSAEYCNEHCISPQELQLEETEEGAKEERQLLLAPGNQSEVRDITI